MILLIFSQDYVNLIQAFVEFVQKFIPEYFPPS